MSKRSVNYVDDYLRRQLPQSETIPDNHSRFIEETQVQKKPLRKVHRGQKGGEDRAFTDAP